MIKTAIALAATSLILSSSCAYATPSSRPCKMTTSVADTQINKRCGMPNGETGGGDDNYSDNGMTGDASQGTQTQHGNGTSNSNSNGNSGPNVNKPNPHTIPTMHGPN